MATTKDKMKIVTGMTILAVFVFVIIAIVMKPSLAENTLITHILGIIEGATIIIVSYYFGTSKSSQDKQDLLEKKITEQSDKNE